MKSSTKLTGIAAAVASLLATGAASASGHSVDAKASVSLAGKDCSGRKGCPKEGKKEETKEFRAIS